MPSIPLPFVVGLLLLLLLARLARGDGEAPPNRPFLALVAACALQSALIGVRWACGIAIVGSILPIVAAALPPLVYASFGDLAAVGRRRATAWLHALPAGLVLLLVAFWRAPVDLALILIDLGYVAALLCLARRGPDALGRVRLEGAMPTYRALQAAAATLVGSALVDGLVAFDFAWSKGAHATDIVAAANLLCLLVLGFAATVAGRSRPPADVASSQPVAPASPPEDDQASADIVAQIDDLIRSRELFRDANLNLNRLARRAGLPARRISMAINRLRAQNVSQYINAYRIAEACRLLETTDQPVTRIMLDAGFQTKSNFNREFRRVTGTTPMAWRTKAAGG